MKKLIAVILALTMVFAMAAIAHADGYTAEEEAEAEAYHIDLIYSNVFNPKEWNYKAAEKFAEMVTERTEGHVKVEFHGLNELDCYRDSVVHAVNGDKWIGLEEPSLFADWVGDCAFPVSDSSRWQFLLGRIRELFGCSGDCDSSCGADLSFASLY